MNDFFEDVGLEWNNCVLVCKDGAAAMAGRISGFQIRVKSESNGPTTFTHCMIHWEALVAEKIFLDLNTVLQDAVKVKNLIKIRALNSRLFANFCEEMESNFTTLLLHTEVRCLSKG